MIHGFITKNYKGLQPCEPGEVNFDEVNREAKCDKKVAAQSSRQLVRQSSTRGVETEAGDGEAEATDDEEDDEDEAAAKKKKEIQNSLGAIGMMSDWVSFEVLHVKIWCCLPILSSIFKFIQCKLCLMFLLNWY